MVNKRRWVCFFSQSGKEIADLSEVIHRNPDVIFSNRKTLEGVDTRIKDRVILLPPTPSIKDYLSCLQKEDLITLHGFLRIVPKEICDMFTIYNGHPGLITVYPELKGKDKQQDVFLQKEKYPIIGSVIHKVVAEVDAGEILYQSSIKNTGSTLEEVYDLLRSTSMQTWVQFFQEYS